MSVEQKVLLAVGETGRIIEFYGYLFNNLRDQKIMIEAQIANRYALERIHSLR